MKDAIDSKDYHEIHIMKIHLIKAHFGIHDID